MRLYAEYKPKHIRSLKALGNYICDVWAKQVGLSVTVNKISRSEQSYVSTTGFVILESLCGYELCHFSAANDTLTITPESEISNFQRNYLDCHANYLAIAKPQNSAWRKRVLAYQTSRRLSTKNGFQDGDVVALQYPYETIENYDDVVVIQRRDNDWYAINTDGRAAYISIDLGTIYSHGGLVVDIPTLPALDTQNLANGLINNGTLIYQEANGVAQVVGRPMTRGERVVQVLSGFGNSSPWGAVIGEQRPFFM